MNARHHTKRILVFAVFLVIAGGGDTLFAQAAATGSLKALAQPKITMTRAIETATQANPRLNVLSASLDNENGYLVYSVKLAGGLDVKIDAGNGSILGSDHRNPEDRLQTGTSADSGRETGSDGEHADSESRGHSEGLN